MAAPQPAPANRRYCLGVDPGLAATGYALLDGEKPLAWGVWRCGPDQGSEEERRAEYCARLRELLASLAVPLEAVTVALEKQFVATGRPGPGAQRRAQAALGLALLRWALEQAAREAGVHVVHISPQAAKRALVGHGGAEKRAMLQMARLRLGLTLQAQEEHIADAAGLALAAQAQARADAVRQGELPCR